MLGIFTTDAYATADTRGCIRGARCGGGGCVWVIQPCDAYTWWLGIAENPKTQTTKRKIAGSKQKMSQA